MRRSSTAVHRCVWRRKSSVAVDARFIRSRTLSRVVAAVGACVLSCSFVVNSFDNLCCDCLQCAALVVVFDIAPSPPTGDSAATAAAAAAAAAAASSGTATSSTTIAVANSGVASSTLNYFVPHPTSSDPIALRALAAFASLARLGEHFAVSDWSCDYDFFVVGRLQFIFVSSSHSVFC